VVCANAQIEKAPARAKVAIAEILKSPFFMAYLLHPEDLSPGIKATAMPKLALDAPCNPFVFSVEIGEISGRTEEIELDWPTPAKSGGFQPWQASGDNDFVGGQACAES